MVFSVHCGSSNSSTILWRWRNLRKLLWQKWGQTYTENDLPDITKLEDRLCTVLPITGSYLITAHSIFVGALLNSGETNLFLTVELLSKNNRNTQQETFNFTTVDFRYLLDATKQIHELKICMHKSQVHPHSTDAMKGRHWLPLHHLHGLFPPMGYKLSLLLTIIIILGIKRLKICLICSWQVETFSCTLGLLAAARQG